MNTVYEVSQINAYLKDMLDRDPLLSGVYIRGEVSNYKLYPSGHHYFTLKDQEGALRCVMFKSSAVRLRFRPENGMKVICMGRVSVYPRDGAYQLYCAAMTPDGIGDLHMAFEQLKRKLHAEGLFDQAHKKPIPPYPHRVAIVTSSAGAAVHDMLSILSRRYPLAHVVLVPVRVQGEEAPGEIIEALNYINRHRLADVIITGRGGGSIEDLWAFNDEGVARAIYNSQIPVISAVGHEPDVTISDYVADLRAATPSNAAELVSPDRQELLPYLDQMHHRLAGSIAKRLQAARQSLTHLQESRVLQDPANYVADRRLRVDLARQKLQSFTQAAVEAQKRRFVALASGLDAMSPLKVLGRGYSVARKEGGAVLRSIVDVSPNSSITVTVEDGTIFAAVTHTEEVSREQKV